MSARAMPRAAWGLRLTTAAVDAHLATYDASGTVSGIDDRSIIAVLVGALKELAANIRGFADSFTTNELTFDRATGTDMTLTHQLCIEKSDRTPVCVTGDQLSAMLTASTAGASRSDGQQEEAPAAAPEPEVPDADTTTTTMPAEATDTQLIQESSPGVIPALPEPANDDQSVDNLPATATE